MEENIAYLNGPAARLLLTLLVARRDGMRSLKAVEMRRMAGIAHHTRFFLPAIDQLEQLGMVRFTRQGHRYEFEIMIDLTSTALVNHKTDRQIDRSIYRNIDAEAAEHGEGDKALPVPDGENVLKVPSSGERGPKSTFSEEDRPKSPFFDLEQVLKVPSSPTNMGQKAPIPNMGQEAPVSEEDGTISTYSGNGVLSYHVLKREAIEVDLMDDSGDLARANSPAQIRRRAQVAVVQKTWKHFFPAGGELLAANAKQFLRSLGNSAEECYDFFERIAQRHPRNPLTYARVCLEREGAEPAPSPAPVASVYVPDPEEPFDQAEAERVDRAAHKARVALWRRTHPNEPVPEDL